MLYDIALSLVPGIGPVNARNLIAYCGSAEAVFKEKSSQLLRIPGFGNYMLNALKSSNTFKRAEQEVKYTVNNNIEVLLISEPNYPNKLKHCDDAPIVLYTKGNIDFNTQPLISFVGTRNPSPYGIEVCKQVIAELAPLKPIVVSGLALGIDTCAHRAAIENELNTLAVLGHGLDKVYPSANKNLAKQITQQGALLTEFTSETIPDRENFPLRNRIVAGISEVTIVIESAVKGGSLITAELALGYNRDVFAVPGRITDTSFLGCNHLIQQNKAEIFTSVPIFLQEMGWVNPTNTSSKMAPQASLFIELSAEEKAIVTYLQSQQQTTIDALSLALKIPMSKVNGSLLSLELNGLVRALPGKLFECV